VRRAHEDGLRVSTRFETAADFHHAILAGVDEINHLPGFRPEGNNVATYGYLARYEITGADARLADRQRVVVVTTLGQAIQSTFDGKEKEEARRAVREMLVRNLRILKRHLVALAVGSDSFRQTSAPEALNLSKLQVFDNRELLKMWCETTAATIFPKRKIGQLKEDYEANFLVLSGDPLQDFTQTQRSKCTSVQRQLHFPSTTIRIPVPLHQMWTFGEQC